MKVPELFPPYERCFVGKMRVMGIFHTGKRRFIRDNTEKQDELTLKREYDNKYDDYAVAVYDGHGNKLGYLEKKENEETAYYLDSGYECIAVVSEMDKKSATVGIIVDVYCISDAENMKSLKASFERHLKELLF